MSSEEIARSLNEERLEQSTNGVWGFIGAIAIKYGLPSICCIWLFYVIWCKDKTIENWGEKMTTALVESNHARADQTQALKDLATAIKEKSN